MKREAMAPQDRARDTDRMLDALAASPRTHDFFALLRQLEAMHPELPRLGRALRPLHEPLRLGQEPELDFAPAALEKLDARSGGPPRLAVRFFGLLGPQGPMPLHFTEHVRERLRQRNDPTTARFLDVFHHRLLLLFYRAWARAQPAAQHDRPRDDRFAAWLGSCAGLDHAAGRDGPVPHAARLHQAGLLASRSRHPEGLGKLLTDHFRVPIRIECNVPQWMPLDAQERPRLGLSRARMGRGSSRGMALGVDAAAGTKVPDRQYRFRVIAGPLSLAHYEEFASGGPAWRALHDWVRGYAGLDLRWDLKLVLRAQDAREPRLDRRVRLGVTTWIGRSRQSADRADLHLRPDTSTLVRQGVHHA